MLYGNMKQITMSTGVIPIAIATADGSTALYSASFKLNYGQSVGVWSKAASSGTVALKIQIEQSAVAPTTEGSADANYVIGNGVADVDSNLANTTAVVKTISPVPMMYARLKIIGLSGNDATTTLAFKFFIQELVGM